MAKEQEYIENHPILHDWQFKRDEVVKVRKGVPILIRRHLWCTQCPHTAVDVIDTYRWERVGHRQYSYVPNVVLLRITKQEFLKTNFLSTTDLPPELKEKLR